MYKLSIYIHNQCKAVFLFRFHFYNVPFIRERREKSKNLENVLSHITFIEDFSFYQHSAGMKGYLLDANTQRKKLETQNMAEDNVPCNSIIRNR